jgi:hypothetical protein
MRQSAWIQSQSEAPFEMYAFLHLQLPGHGDSRLRASKTRTMFAVLKGDPRP